MIFFERRLNNWRVLKKEHTIVLGMTEREGGPTRVDDIRLFNYPMDKESSRDGKEAELHEDEIRNSLIIVTDEPAADDSVIDENATQIFLDDDDEDEDLLQQAQDIAAEDRGVEAPASGTGSGTRFRMNAVFEAAEGALFGPKERRGPKRTVLFIVEDRSAQTLLPIVRKYVQPWTYIFSDKWLAYWQLRDGYNHFMVVHKKRFVQYHFFHNLVVLKVTTNHIERIWVELRKDLRGVRKEDVERRLREVPYRLLRLAGANHDENLWNVITDIKAYVADAELRESGSAFRQARQMEEE